MRRAILKLAHSRLTCDAHPRSLLHRTGGEASAVVPREIYSFDDAELQTLRRRRCRSRHRSVVNFSPRLPMN